MQLLNEEQLKWVAGGNANSGYSPDCAGGSSKSSRSSNSSNSNSNGGGSFDPYAGTDDCVRAIGFGALSGFFGGPGSALLGVLSNGYNACIGSSSNGSGRASSNSDAGNCGSGIGGVCN